MSLVPFWIAVILANLFIAGLAYWRLAGLPDIPIRLSDELVVEALSEELEPGESGMVLVRGDRVTTVAGQAVEKLSDLVLISKSLSKAQGDEFKRLDYQAIRPLHRFSLTLTGAPEDARTLPAGVEPTDVLIEVDGRTLPGKVGTEGLRSIIASRPQALLGLERENAVFTGSMRVEQGNFHFVWILGFILSGLMSFVLWRFHHEKTPEVFPLLIGCQSILLAATFIIVFKFNWVTSDMMLAGLVGAGMILCRPVAYIGHSWVENGRATSGTWAALTLSLLSCIAVWVTLGIDVLSPRRALMLAGTIGFFFIFYELVAGFSGSGRSDSKTERSMYLVGIIVITVIASLISFLLNPVAFSEIVWVGFVVAVLGLMWTGDVIVALRGPGLSELDELRSQELRRSRIENYLGGLRDELPGCKFRFVVLKGETSVVIGEGLGGFEVRQADRALHDAASILVEEADGVPSNGLGESPIVGIAKTMHMPVFTELSSPEGGLEVPNIHIILSAAWVSRGADPMPECPIELVQKAQSSLDDVLWAALVLEAFSIERGENAGPLPTIDPKRVQELEGQVQGYEDELKAAQEREEDLHVRLDAHRSQSFQDLAPSVLRMNELLEPGLIDALDYLLKSKEPIIFAGAWGSGKRYTAACAVHLDQKFEQRAICLDVSHYLDSGRPDSDAFPEQLFLAAEGGALFVESARLLSAHQLKALTHRAKERGFRLLLSFDDPKAESRSVLDAYPDEVKSALADREVVIPSFHRREVRSAIVQYLVASAADALDKEIVGVASDAMELLLEWKFVGEIAECRTLIWSAVSRANKEVLDAEDLGFAQ